MEHLTPAVIAGVVPVVVTIVLRYLLSSRQSQATRTEHGCIVQYGKAMKAFVLVMAFASGALVGVVAVIPPGNWFATIFLAGLFFVLVFPLYLEFFHVKIVATDEGLLCRSPWRAGRNVGWEEIRSVDFSSSLQWYRIRTESKGVIRLHVFLSGLQTIFDLLEQKTGIKVEQQNLLKMSVL